MHIVKYTESERGCGGEVWFNSFTTKEQALHAVEECNKDYDFSKETPSYYITAQKRVTTRT